MSRRVESLDALRGIAALAVVFSHCSLAVPGFRQSIDATYLLRPFVAGGSAVYIFFILSGFVLFLSLDGRRQNNYTVFLVKRIMRIYPPLIIAILLSAALYVIISPVPRIDATEWLKMYSWQAFPSTKIIAGHVLLLDTPEFRGLDNVIWSLSYEIRISLAFPLIAFAVRWSWWKTVLATALLSAACLAVQPFTRPLLGVIDLLATIQYVFLFAIGAAMALKMPALSRMFERMPKAGAAAVVLGLVLVSSGRMPVASAGAVFIVLACAFCRPIVRSLEFGPLIWLGRISYSLYLSHLIVLLTMVYGFPALPLWGAVATAIPISLVVAELGFLFVERPSIWMGRRLARRIERAGVPSSVAAS